MKAKTYLLALPAALALGALASAQDVQRFCPPNPNSTGSPAVLACGGSASIRMNDTCLQVFSVPRGSTGLFLFGDTRQRALPFGAGNLCVTGDVHRLPPVLADSHCCAHYDVDLWYAPETRFIQAGETWHFQYLYWDHGAGQRNLSSGLAITFAP
jgi:hypothetical protein